MAAIRRGGASNCKGTLSDGDAEVLRVTTSKIKPDMVQEWESLIKNLFCRHTRKRATRPYGLRWCRTTDLPAPWRAAACAATPRRSGSWVAGAGPAALGRWRPAGGWGRPPWRAI